MKSARQGEEIALIANQTPFYGEAGGQMGDTGTFTTASATIEVTDVQRKVGDLFVHLGKVTKGELKVGDAVEMKVDGKRRTSMRANHSATHLLHEALRRRLGAHVTQKGSLVAPDRLRFDFSHSKGMSPEDIAVVEREVNDRVRDNEAVETRLMTPQDAIEAGAMALFGEKYGDEVRVVSMGGKPANENKIFSTELCGGTHVRRTGDIGLFKIVSEGAVGAGVRRIEAVTGAAAEAYIAEQQRVLDEAAAALKTLPSDLTQRIAALLDERKRLERELTETRKAAAAGGAGSGPAAQAGQRRHARRAPARQRAGQGTEGHGRRDQAPDRLRRGGAGRGRGRQGLAGGRRHRRSHQAAERRRPGEGRQRGAGRAGRRRPPRHGPGRRPRRLARQGRAGRDRKRDRRGGEGGGIVVSQATTKRARITAWRAL